MPDARWPDAEKRCFPKKQKALRNPEPYADWDSPCPTQKSPRSRIGASLIPQSVPALHESPLKYAALAWVALIHHRSALNNSYHLSELSGFMAISTRWEVVPQFLENL
jgi:hypothetical protein